MEQHEMLGYVDGDWIKYLCPECDSQRWINSKTGEMKTSGTDISILHSGSMGPIKTKNLNVLQHKEFRCP